MSDDWSWGGTWHDRRQNERIGDLQAELSRARHSAATTSRNLRNQLKRMSGDLSQRIDTLSRALDTFVELSDLRFDLQGIESGSPVRDRVRRYLVAAADSSEPPALVLPDIQDYWLRPAGLAFAALLENRDAAKDLAAARELDERRTALFLLVALALTERPAEAAEHLTAALGPTQGRTISHAQWGLWQAARDGFFGDGGYRTMREWLAGLVHPVGDTANDTAWDSAVRRALPGKGGMDDPVQVRAAARLVRLRDWCAESLPGDGGGTERPDAGHLFGIIEELVDEGTIDEAPLLRRAEALRTQIEERSADTPPPGHFDDPVDTVDAALMETIGDGEATSAARVEVLALAAPQLLRIADGLRDEACAAYTNDAVRVKRYGVEIGVDLHGPNAEDLGRAEKQLDRRHPATPVTGWMVGTIAVAAFAALIVVLGQIGLGVVVALVAAGLGVKWARVASANSAVVRERAETRKALEEEIGKAKGRLAGRQEGIYRAQNTAPGVHADVVALLGEVGRG